MDERLDLCYRALMYRHNRLLHTPSDVAPILWQNGALARLEKENQSTSCFMADILQFPWAMLAFVKQFTT